MQVLSSSSASGIRASGAARRAPIAAPRRGLIAVAVARPSAEASRAAGPSSSTASAAGDLISSRALLSGVAGSVPLFLMQSGAAMATEGAYGILEGRTAALIHPAVMFTLLASTLYAGYLGWQWRTTRTLGDEIRELRKQMPAVQADGTAAVSPIAGEIEAKEAQRKTLLAGKFKDKHEIMGSILLASGVGIAIEGCVNTYMRTGKLFPGPHLFAGAGIVALWAFAAALVPAMEKGDNNARTMHIAANVANVGLFLWQVPTGLQIVDKVFQFTQWP